AAIITTLSNLVVLAKLNLRTVLIAIYKSRKINPILAKSLVICQPSWIKFILASELKFKIDILTDSLKSRPANHNSQVNSHIIKAVDQVRISSIQDLILKFVRLVQLPPLNLND